ncbi:hypothetical protein [Streptomyces sp. CA-111067]|uniref:hypothetical protein n=1 Tax=Streptomyces sp. CA-111067 TaxID=3240046 RepID=UPI003D98F1B5
MTITEKPPETDTGPAAMIRSLVVGAVAGAIIAGVVVGIVVRNAALGGGAGGVFVLLVVVLTLSSRWDRRHNPKPPAAEKVRALAMIESRRATDGEMADVPIRFDLTVAPDGQPAYRVEFTQPINLVDIPAYQERRVVVVEYPADKPWSVRIVTSPDPEWERRAAVASIDSAPPSTLAEDTSRTGSYCLLGFLGILLGAAVVIVLFRGDLFKDDDGTAAHRPPSAGAPGSTSSTSSTSSTVATTSGSLLENGLMRTTANSMIKAAGTSSVVTFRIEEHRMSADGVPAGETPAEPPIDLRTVPYEQLPGLVRDARTGLGLQDPGGWHIDIGDGGRTGGMLIRVTVSDGQDSASLDADARGRVTARHPH